MKKTLVSLTLLALVLGMTDLGDVFFWADEGWTLILARNVLSTGFPKAGDSSYQLCPDYGFTSGGFWTAQPWFHFYLAAGAIWMFGKSVFWLRVPFVLIGVACVPLLWMLCERLKLQKNVRIVASLLLVVNVPFLLLIRNIRYYALLPFFTLVLLILYVDMKAGSRRRWIWFGTVSLFFMHTMETACLAVLAAVFLHAACIERDRGLLWRLGVSQLFNVVLYLPWFIWVWRPRMEFFSTFTTAAAGKNVGFLDAWLGALFYILHLIQYHVPVLLGLPLLIMALLGRKPEVLRARVWSLLALVIGFTSLIMAYVRNDNLWAGYVISTIPLCMIVAAALICGVARNRKMVMVTLSAVVLLANVFNLPPWPYPIQVSAQHNESDFERRLRILPSKMVLQEVAFLPFHYGIELLLPYEGPVEGIVMFLNERAKPGDTFFATNDAHTIHFMTGLRRLQDIPFTEPPTWIIRRGMSPWHKGVCRKGGLDPESYLESYLHEHPYEVFELDRPDLYHENDPVLPQHHFTTPLPRRRVVLFHHRSE